MGEINRALYERYLKEFILEAMVNSDGTVRGIAGCLWDKQVKGWLVRDKQVKQRALEDARRAFEEHRHWPLEIILKHLGVEVKTRA